ncbi:hypothetical protein a10_09488 [Streptomyces acidiscabies]|nr:hypothetical protein a10_09488 [Streptomyces acidiscabies]GAV46360.1 hypothetical protein Saa2_09367 [Streptomyces acidiscabies]
MYRLVGTVLAVLYVLASNPVPSAAAWSTCRISPVARDTTVPSAIRTDARPTPACFFSAACRRRATLPAP